jgi:N-acyl-D-aspartate/D-glutamate deacylase
VGREPEVRRYLQLILGPETEVYGSLGDYATAVEAGGLATNLATLVGHGTLRSALLGFDDRPARDSELATLHGAARAALEDGALGVSSGLIYSPGSFATTGELVEVARAAAELDRLYVTHIRDEMDNVDRAIDEALQVGLDSGARVQISHHKTAGKQNWGRTLETLDRLERARDAGSDVCVDVYPYTAGSTILAVLLPPWVSSGGVDELVRRLGSSDVRERVRHDLDHGLAGWQRVIGNDGWADVRVASAARHPELEGRSIAAIAEVENVDPLDLVADLLIDEKGQTTVVVSTMAEEDVARVLASPLAMIGSDGIPVPGKPHPRWAGAFARVLGRYTREQRLLTLEAAVHKMTEFPANRFGLENRGVLAEGMAADIAVFDFDSILDAATYDEPLLPPTGIHHVLVNGQFGVRDGFPTGKRAGVFLTG